MSTEKSSQPLPESGKHWKDLESIKNHFDWKHNIINRIKSWKLWNSCRILSKCTNLQANTWWNLKASNLYFTNYEASIISNHFTLPLHISALELRSIHHPHRCFWENGLRARHSWPKIKDVSRGACKSRMEENLWSSVSTALYSSQFCKIIGILYPLLWASGRSWLRLACGLPASHTSELNCVITP